MTSMYFTGTHWGYEILSMLLKGKAEREQSQKIMLMMEAVSLSDMEAMPSPRILNTHLPLQFLPQQMKEKKNKMLVIMRNPKDVLVSGYYHAKSEKQFRFDGAFDVFLKVVMSGKGKCDVILENPAYGRTNSVFLDQSFPHSHIIYT